MDSHRVVGVSIGFMHHSLATSPCHNWSLGGVHSRLHGSNHGACGGSSEGAGLGTSAGHLFDRSGSLFLLLLLPVSAA